MTENPENDDNNASEETYSAMLADYLDGQGWIGPADLPLVFHLKKLCAQLDRDGLDKAAHSAAYLQAFTRLDKRRPGAQPGPADDGGIPGQTNIFDFLDDD